MTVAVVWQEEGGLWCASDTRISRPGNGGGVIITTDAGAKIYPLLVTCNWGPMYVVNGNAQVPPQGFAQQVGLVFAGNILIASQTIATVASLCQTLQTAGNDLPTLAHVGELLRKVVGIYVQDFRAALHDVHTPNYIDFLLFGLCPVARELQIWRVKDEANGEGFEVTLDRQPAGVGDAAVIGSQAGRFADRLNEVLELQGDIGFRVPLRIVREMADAGAGDVGGTVAVAFATRNRFFHYWTGMERQDGFMRIMNGMDISALEPIGPAFIAGHGMGIDLGGPLPRR